MVPAAAAQVGEISIALNAGRHTTTSTNWYWMDDSRHTALIDSPGFQEFGLRQLQATDLARLMPDIGGHAAHCRFYNCSHLHEPGCGVRVALARGEIHPSRYRIYNELHAELSETGGHGEILPATTSATEGRPTVADDQAPRRWRNAAIACRCVDAVGWNVWSG